MAAAAPIRTIASNPLPVGMAQRDGRGRSPPSTEDRIDTLYFDMIGGIPIRLYAVFDGHGGDNIAEYAKKNLLNRILFAIQTAQSATPAVTADWITKQLEKVFVEFDMELYLNYTDSQKTNSPIKDSGSCATVAVVTPTDVIVGYIGDSPCILVNKTSGMLMNEIHAHWPTFSNRDEVKRIIADGMNVQKDTRMEPARVNGSLMISRAFGDFYLKKNIGTKDSRELGVTPHPTVVVWPRGSNQILAVYSDGLTDTGLTGGQLAASFAAAVKKNPEDLNTAAEAVLNNYIASAASSYKGDDLSLILVDVSLASHGGRRRTRKRNKGRKRFSYSNKKKILKT